MRARRAYARDIAVGLDSVYKNITAEFALSDNGTVYDFYLCSDVGEYMRLTNKSADEYEPWMVGSADYASKHICILSPRVVEDKSPGDMEKIIVHETVHVAFNVLRDADKTEPWTAEGIAVLYADQIDLDYVDRERFPLISDLLTDKDFADNGGYNHCGIYVRYFLRTYGMETFKKLYSGDLNIGEYIFPDFERQAISAYASLHK